MSDLQNQTPANTYKGLLQVGDYTNGVDSTAKYVSDGEGTPSALSISESKVGVGTASPQASLHISDGTPAIRLTDTTPTTDTVSQVWADTDNVGGLLLAADITDVGTDPFISARIGGTGVTSEKMRIDSNGNCGIGTTNPVTKLDINEVAGNLDVIQSFSKGGVGQARVGLCGTTSQVLQGALADDLCIRSDGHNIRFGTASATRTDMTIDSDGNVGVGVTNPSFAFEVKSNSDEAILKGISPNGLSNVFIKKTNAGDTEFSNSFVSGGAAGDFSFTNGKVGIGTTNPENKLHLSTTGSDGLRLSVDSQSYYHMIRPNGDSLYIGADEDDSGGTGADIRLNVKGDEKMRIDSDGNCGIGTTNPTVSRLDVWQTEASTNSCIKTVRPGTADRKHLAFFNDYGVVGDIKTSGLTTSYNTSSDYRLKENVVELTDALDRVCQLKPSRFNFIADKNKTVDGFLAHEVQEIVPEAISGEKDAIDEDGKLDYQGIDQSKLVPLLTKAIQEQQQIIEDLKSRLETLEQ